MSQRFEAGFDQEPFCDGRVLIVLDFEDDPFLERTNPSMTPDERLLSAMLFADMMAALSGREAQDGRCLSVGDVPGGAGVAVMTTRGGASSDWGRRRLFSSRSGLSHFSSGLAEFYNRSQNAHGWLLNSLGKSSAHGVETIGKAAGFEVLRFRGDGGAWTEAPLPFVGDGFHFGRSDRLWTAFVGLAEVSNMDGEKVRAEESKRELVVLGRQVKQTRRMEPKAGSGSV